MIRLFLFGVFFGFVTGASFAQRSSVDSLRTAINPTVLEAETIENILTLSDILMNRGEMEEARDWLLMGYDLAEDMGDSESIFDVLIEFSSFYLNRELADSSLVMLSLAEPHVQTSKQRASFHNLRGVSRKMKEQFILAVEEYEKAGAYADSIGDFRSAAGIQMNLGDIYSSLGDDTQAMEAYYHGLEFAEETADSTFLAVGYNNVGLMFHNLEDYEQANYYLQKAEEISRNLNFTVNLRRVMVNQGNLNSRLENFDAADRYYEQALQLSRETNNPVSEIRVLFNIGESEARKGNTQRAAELFNQVYREAENIGTVEGLFLSATSLGDLAREAGNLSGAIRWYERANEIVSSGNFTALQVTAYENLYRIYKEAGDYPTSLEWLEQFNDLNESLRSSEKNRQMAEYEIRFNMKRAEQEAEILEARQERTQSQLRLQQWLIGFSFGGTLLLIFTAIVLVRSNSRQEKTNSELKTSNQKLSTLNDTIQKQNKQLEQVNQIKNKLFAIIAHDLRGPLSSLQSLLYLIREHELSKDEMDEISASLERNLQENASMMDNLLAWAKSQMSGIQINTRSFNLKRCVHTVTDHIKFQTEKKQITLNIDVPDDLEIEADYDMIKLVIRNLVNNAIKFSTGGGTISIEAEQAEDEDHVQIKVRDNGIGIKKEDQEKIFSTHHFTRRGTDNEKGSGLGLTLCKEFIEKHNGRIWFETKEKKGTTFIIALPDKIHQNTESIPT